MSQKKHKKVLILGGGISGLICAAVLEKAGHDYLIFEALDEVGGSVRGQEEHEVWMDFGLKSIPVGDVETNPLLQLKKELNLNFAVETLLESPLSFTKSGFVPFVGFGETKNRNLIEQLQYYTHSPRFLVSNGWVSLVSELKKIIPEKKLKTQAHITKINVAGEKITEVVVNGEDIYSADHIISALPLRILLGLIPGEYVSQKTMLKFSKLDSYSALSLDIASVKTHSTQKNLLVLNDEDFYVLGQFVSQVDPLKQSKGLQISTWMALVDDETAIDDEAMSKCLKTMKKLIKKAYPELIENSSWERILVAPQSHNGTVPWNCDIENLWVVNPQVLENSQYVGGVIEKALSLSQSLSAQLGEITGPETQNAQQTL